MLANSERSLFISTVDECGVLCYFVQMRNVIEKFIYGGYNISIQSDHFKFMEENLMRKTQIVSLIVLVLAIFVSIDLGLNFAYCLIPELQDGISSHSFLQETFGIFGNSGWTKVDFFYAFEKSIWFSFFMIIENIIVWILKEIKK